MEPQTSKVTIHMVSSLDGFIAKKDGNVSWMKSNDNYEKGITLTDEYITDFLKSIDCYVMGSKTYEHALKLGWPYGDIPVFVLSKRNLTTDKKNVEFHSGELNEIVNGKLKPNFKNIWMVGGSMLTKEFIQLGLADKIVLSMIPVILGDGKLFFDYIEQEHLLHLENVIAFKDGMVELYYDIRKE